MEKIKLAIFDIEGTISDKVKIPAEVIAGFEALHRQGIKTTVVTGTGFIRVKDLLGEHFDSIISEGMPIGVENGGKLVTSHGQILVHFPLKEEERNQFLEYSFSVDPQYVVHYPHEKERAVIWTPKADIAEDMRAKHSFFADIYNDEQINVLNRAKEDNPSIIITQAGNAFVNQPVPAHYNTVVNEGSIHLNTWGIDKGTAMVEIAKLAGVNLSEVLAGGNYYNDLPMFSHQIGQRILVGELDISAQPYEHQVTRVDSIESLGLYLQSFK